MSEEKRQGFLEKIAQGIFGQVFGQVMNNAAKIIERAVKRAIRNAALILAGIIIALLGIAFISVGAVKGLALLIPSWLAWTIVGIILVLLGMVIALASNRK